MIGPSSSHTAGAVKIGNIARTLLGRTPKGAKIVLYNSFAKTGRGHGTDKALLAGICGYAPDDVRIRGIFDNCPIEYEFEFDENPDYHPNTAEITVTDGVVTTVMRGVSPGGGRVEIREIDSMPVSFGGDHNTLIVFHYDRKGIIGKLSTWLSDNGINIAYMNSTRQEREEKAVTVIETDQKVSDFKSLESLSDDMRVAYYECR